MTKVTDEDSSRNPAVICVFCGAYPGNNPAYLESATELGKLFHQRGIQLVYGAGTTGVMGQIAKTLVSLSGPQSVHGVIPEALMKYEQHDASTEAKREAEYGQMTVVPDMHTRKRLMVEKVIQGGPGSGFVALSGGFGTMEELMEVTTWNSLGIHSRGIVVYNINGFYDGLLQWIQKASEEGFIGQANAGIIVEAKTAEEVVRALENYQLSEGQLKLNWKES